MKRFVIYTDGSFGDTGEVHGGVVFWADNKEDIKCIHVCSTNEHFVSMRNIGGEVLAAYSAIMSIVQRIKKSNEDLLETYELDLVFDYKGIGQWATGGWKTNKTATRWFAKNVNKLLKEVPNLKVNYIWVKGHGMSEGNNLADRVSEYTMQYCRRNNIPICSLDEYIDLN